MVFGMTIGSTRALIIIFVIIHNYKYINCELSEVEGETLLEDFLICRSCGADAAVSNFIINKFSGKSLASSNETIFGKKDILVQIIENPLGVRFEVIALKRASCVTIGIWNTSFSWFSGYAWKACLCPRCAEHLGWMFEPLESATKNQIFPSEKGFYLLIIDTLIAETGVITMVDPNRKINRLTDKDIEFLDECEETFKNRYSLEDEEFIKHCNVETPSPPIVDPWNAEKPNFHSGGKGKYRDNQHGGRGRRFYNNRNPRGRNHPYNPRGPSSYRSLGYK